MGAGAYYLVCNITLTPDVGSRNTTINNTVSLFFMVRWMFVCFVWGDDLVEFLLKTLQTKCEQNAKCSGLISGNSHLTYC
jgi:hypothetical protein